MKKFLFLSLTGLLLAGLSSCSDDLTPDRNTPLEKDMSYFVNIDIRSTESMTRAEDLIGDGALDNYKEENYDPTAEPDFNKGTDDENKVSTIYLIFYDEKGNRVSTSQVRKDNNNNGDEGRDNNENSIYKGVVQVDVTHGSLPPAYVMAFINPITSTSFEINPDFATLDNLEKVTRPRIIDDSGNFAMSKSVYYGHNPNNNNQMERIMATPIEEGQLFKTDQAAQEALNKALDPDSEESDNEKSPVIDIYVERYAAKVNFSIPKDAYTITIKDKTLKFIPEYWAVNAYESETYVTKSFFNSIDPETGEVGGIMSFEDMNKAIGNATEEQKKWFWNSEKNHRCYWAQSPAYYAEKYPRVADDILDKRTGYAAEGGYSLGYYSYNDMVENADHKLISKARKLTGADKDQKYKMIDARENTVSGKSLIKAYEDPAASPKAAIGSVVLVGHYEIEDKEYKDDECFYVMGSVNTSGNAANIYTLYESYDKMLDHFVLTTIPFAYDKEGKKSFFLYDKDNAQFTNEDYKNMFIIEHPKKDVRGELVIDSRFVTIQLNPTWVNDYLNEKGPRIYALINGIYTEITESNINDINQQMLYAAGTAQGFQGGKAYFTIPIKHLGFYRSGNPNAGKNANDKDFKWNEVKSGDFGLVRNHIYTIIVDDIIGLGNGIPDPDDPIVPPTDPEEYYVGARVIVLNWAVVPAQHVTL